MHTSVMYSQYKYDGRGLVHLPINWNSILVDMTIAGFMAMTQRATLT